VLKKTRKDILVYIGFLCLLIWSLDFLNIVFLIHKPQYLLWLSSVGLLATAIALIKRDSFLIFVLFCSLFVFEAIWSIGFLSRLLFNIPIPGVVDYAFEPTYATKDFILTLYHLLIPSALLIGFIKQKKVYKYGWLFALFYTSILVFLTYFFVNKVENVNCVHTITYCRSFIPFLYKFDNPIRIYIGLLMATVFVFIPTNYTLYRIGKYLKWD